MCHGKCQECIDRNQKIQDLLFAMNSNCTHPHSRCSYFRAPEHVCLPCKQQGVEYNALLRAVCRSRN